MLVYKKSMDTLYFIVEKLALFLLAACMTLLFVQTVLRFTINYSLSWAEELCRYMSIWVTFLGGGIGIRHNIHVGFDLLKNKLPEKPQKYLHIIISLGIIAFSFVLLQGGFDLSSQASKQLSSSLGISMSFVYVSLLVGAI